MWVNVNSLLKYVYFDSLETTTSILQYRSVYNNTVILCEIVPVQDVIKILGSKTPVSGGKWAEGVNPKPTMTCFASNFFLVIVTFSYNVY